MVGKDKECTHHMLLKSVFKVGSLTLLSRIFGFIRDILTASYLGAGPIADAFFVAFRLPNFFRRLFAEGAFSAAFVPIFSRILTQNGKAAALAFAEHSMAALITILIVLTALAEFFMPSVMYIIAPGFVDSPDQFSLAVEFGRITFPYLLFISLVALMGGVLNSLDKFAAFAAAPILLNLTLIFSLLVLARETPTPGHAMAWGVFIAGILQFLFLLLDCRRHGVNLKLKRPTLTPEVRKLGKLVLPGAFGAGVMQINLLVSTILASFLPTGSVSYLYYADRISQLPLGVIGIAIGTALLPILSKQIRSDNMAQASTTQNHGIELGLMMAIPASVAMLTIPDVILSILFERGAFNAGTTAAAAAALQALGAGVPAYILVKVLAPGFFAREDTKTPVKIAMVSVALNITLNLILMQHYLHVGIAMGTAIAAWVNAGLLGFILHRRGFLALSRETIKNTGLIIAAALLMGAALLYLKQFSIGDSFWAGVIYLMGLVVAGKAVYFTGLVATGVLNRKRLKVLTKGTTS